MEDKVIGPLTLQQFFYLLFGGLLIYLLNSWIPSGSLVRPVFYFLAIPILILALALAFVKIQDRPFIFFLGSFIRYISRPRRRVWQKGQYNKNAVIVDKPKETAVETPRKEFDAARAADLAKVLDTTQTKGEDNGQP